MAGGIDIGCDIDEWKMRYMARILARCPSCTPKDAEEVYAGGIGCHDYDDDPEDAADDEVSNWTDIFS